jgi:hypothetical protein
MSIATQKSLERLRKMGYHAGPDTVVERFYAKQRHDFLGIIDILAIHEETGEILAVQSTTLGQRKEHLRKIADEPRTKLWGKTPHKLQLWSWRKLKIVKKDGKKGKALRWEVVIDEIWK